MRNLIVFLLLLLGACSGGGGSSFPPPVFQPPIGPSWTQFYGSYVGVDSTGSFNFPNPPGSVHYVVEPAPAVQLGQTVTLTFQISGAGTWGFIDPNDAAGPPRLALFLWEKGDDGSGQGVMETYREWHGQTVITNPGIYTISAKLDPTLWTGVFGQTPSAANFQQLLNNLYGVGFTFGGTSSYGHGIYSATGSFHFTLVSYTIK